MLNSLLKIGEWQSQGKSEWDRFLDYPKVELEDKHGNPIKNYTLPIIFDLDSKKVVIEPENLREYDGDHIKNSFPLKIKGGNNKAIYSSAPSKKISQIFKTFFGKEGTEDAKNGELKEAIEKDDESLLTETLSIILSEIFKLKEQFLQQTTHPLKGLIDSRAISERFDLGKNENIVFFTTLIKAEKLGLPKPTLFGQIEDYQLFLKHSFFGKQNGIDSKKARERLCYASGVDLKDVKELDLTTRYSLNKMFVTETKNYAPGFDKKKFSNSYQVSNLNQKKLAYASDYLLNKGFKVRIANLDHVMIPQFLASSKVNLEMALEGLQKKSDLLFNVARLDYLTKIIQDEVEEEVYWISFLAFESDGNFFKSTQVIKDVSNFHFSKIIKTFFEINELFRTFKFVDWNAVMTEYDYDSKKPEPRKINFNSVFKIIPLRKDKEKKNTALNLFKNILENRPIEKLVLFKHFSELMLCHYYGRYASYNNVQQYSKDFFSFAIRDSVFKYHAFIQFLKKLNLINMEETTQNQTEETSANKYTAAIEQFFSEMHLSKEQKAMFYLGRMLNAVEYIQKGKTKTVVQKVNFNGMQKEDIQRLRIALIEKAKQYNAVSKVIFTDYEFGRHFDTNNWKLNPQEAVFFLLTGYSFGVGVKDAEKLTEKENQETI